MNPDPPRRPTLPGLMLLTVALAATTLDPGLAHAELPSAEMRAQPPRASRSALIERGITLNFQGRLEEALEVWRQMRALSPDDPAADVFETSTWYWYENYEAEYPDLEAKVVASSEEAIEKAEARIDRNDEDADAHFYLGSALMNLGRMYGMSGRFVKAGTYGERGRKHLERAYELDPQRVDARYSLGLYYFYASLAPDFVKWLTFLWFVPTGDADRGLAYLEAVEKNGKVHRDDAALVLMNINTYHREGYGLAQALGQKLRRRYPENTVVEFEMIELAMAQAEYETVVKSALELEAREVSRPRDQGRVNVARIWRARAELHLGRPRTALNVLAPFGDGEPATPSWGARWATLTRGQIMDVLGRRDEALAHYQAIIDLELSPLWSRATEVAVAGQEQPFELPASVTLTED